MVAIVNTYKDELIVETITLPDGTEHTFEFYTDILEFEDGIKLPKHLPYCYSFRRANNLRTEVQLAKFFIKMRNRLKRFDLGAYGCPDFYGDFMNWTSTYYGLLSRRVHEATDYRGIIQYSSSEGGHAHNSSCEGVPVYASIRDFTSTPRPTNFVLVDPDEEEGNEVTYYYTFRGLSSGGPDFAKLNNVNPDNDDMWSRKWNYTYEMSKTECGFFRRTKRDSEDEYMFGLELEVNTRISPEEMAHIVRNVEPKQDPFFIMKDDGSITGRYDHSYEIVTVPATPRYLRMEFKKLFKKIDKLATDKSKRVSDYIDTSDNLGNGIHIHVSKDSFTNKSHTRKFLAAWNMPDSTSTKFFQQISGRPSNYQENSYCAIHPTARRGSVVNRVKHVRYNRHAHDDNRGDVNVLCHEEKRATVEVRLFQGIWDINHLLRCIDSVEAMVSFTNGLSYQAFKGHKYKPSTLTTQLKQYILKSGLYHTLRKELK